MPDFIKKVAFGMDRDPGGRSPRCCGTPEGGLCFIEEDCHDAKNLPLDADNRPKHTQSKGRMNIFKTKTKEEKLFKAIIEENLAKAKALLANGADVNALINGGFTPLHKAAEEGNSLMAALLIAESADVNSGDVKGNTPLQVAAEMGTLSGVNPFKGFKEMAELLITRGAGVNA